MKNTNHDPDCLWLHLRWRDIQNRKSEWWAGKCLDFLHGLGSLKAGRFDTWTGIPHGSAPRPIGLEDAKDLTNLIAAGRLPGEGSRSHAFKLIHERENGGFARIFLRLGRGPEMMPQTLALAINAPVADLAEAVGIETMILSLLRLWTPIPSSRAIMPLSVISDYEKSWDEEVDETDRNGNGPEIPPRKKLIFFWKGEV